MKNTSTKSVPIKPSEITPEVVYLNRRQFIKTIGLVGAGTFLAACTQITPSATTEGMSPQASETTDELGELVEQLLRYHQLQQLLRVHD